MSGPESNPEHPELRDDGRPLSPEAADLGPVPPHAPTSPPAWARHPEPDEDAGADDVEHEPDEDAEDEPSKPKPWAPLVAKLSEIRLPKLSWPFGFPSLGSERHEVLPPLSHEPASAPAREATNPEPPARTSAIGRLAARLPAISMKRETRIGLAAMVTFVFLVTGLAANKGWLGDLGLPLMAMNSHSKEDPAEPARPDAAAPPGDKDKAREKEVGPAKKKPEAPPAASAPKAPLTKDNADQHLPEKPPPTPSNSPAKAAEDAAKLEPDPLTAPGLPAPELGPGPASSPPALPDPSSPPTGDSPPLNLPGDKVEAAPAAAESAMPSMPSAAGNNGPPSAPAAEPEPSLPLPTIPGDPLTAMPSTPAPAPAPVSTPAPSPAEPPPVATPAPAVVEAPPAQAEAPPTVRAVEPSPTEKPPTLEQVPAPSMAGGPDPMAAAIPSGTPAAGPAAAEPGWIVIPRGGKRPPPGSSPSGGLTVISEPLKVPDGPAPAADPAAADQVEPVLHRVRSGENFFTISKLYYSSGRYYKALHAANARQVPGITDLAVGDVIRVPPPEALDQALILPAGRPVASAPVQASADRAASTASRDSRPAEPADEVPVAAARRPRVVRPDPEARDEPVRPTYRVKAHDTLRSIARDTLSDPHRAQDILNLNRDAVDDPAALRAGTLLTLPEDAIVGRRGR